MFGQRKDGSQRWRIAGSFIGDHSPWGDTRLPKRSLEKGPGCGGITPLAEVDVDYLPILIDRTITVGPMPLQSTVSLVHSPFVTD